MSTTYREITSHSLQLFLVEVKDALLDGWDISPLCPGDMVGYGFSSFTVTMERNSGTIDKLKQVVGRVQITAKMTPAEKMAKARAALDAKRAEAKLDVDNVLPVK